MSRSRFFENNSSVNQEKFNPEIIRKLTAARLAGYSYIKINSEFSEDDYPEIKALINALGSNILETRFVANKENHKEAQEKFVEMTENFSAESKNKVALIIYSAQLLQYYTVICQDDFVTSQSYEEFVNFLEDNTSKFGDTQKNPFIVEYKLIKIFNGLCLLIDSVSGTIAPIKYLEIQLQQLLNYLTQLNSIVENFKLTAPDYVFPQYLDFVSNYVMAKLLEVNFKVLCKNLAEFSEEEKVQHSDLQQYYITQAASALCTITDLFKYTSDRNLVHVKGVEYCFGQELFVKFPGQDMESMERNIIALRQG